MNIYFKKRNADFISLLSKDECIAQLQENLISPFSLFGSGVAGKVYSNGHLVAAEKRWAWGRRTIPLVKLIADIDSDYGNAVIRSHFIINPWLLLPLAGAAFFISLVITINLNCDCHGPDGVPPTWFFALFCLPALLFVPVGYHFGATKERERLFEWLKNSLDSRSTQIEKSR